MRLLGIAGEAQVLTATITYAEGNPQDTVLESDLTEVLADFNGDKAVPLALTGTVVETPGEAGFTAAIGGWQQADGGNTDAH